MHRNVARKYVKSGGVYCPFCHCWDVQGDASFSQTASGLVAQSVTCNQCKKRWLDLYKLTDVSELQDITPMKIANQL